VSYNSRQVTARHVAARQYSAWSYIASVLINHFPIAVLSDILFCTLLYWMANYVANAGEPGTAAWNHAAMGRRGAPGHIDNPRTHTRTPPHGPSRGQSASSSSSSS
jgi:hypothetical protein